MPGFEKGDRVELVSTPDPYTGLSRGDRGYVTGTDVVPAEVTGGQPERQVWVSWDATTRPLAMVLSQDTIRKVEEGEA